jgi:hypothetical protein
MRRHLAAEWNDVREGFRILCTRRFWRDFADFWAPEAVAKRMDEWSRKQRGNH